MNIPDVCLLMGTAAYQKCSTCPANPEPTDWEKPGWYGWRWCEEWMEANPEIVYEALLRRVSRSLGLEAE